MQSECAYHIVMCGLSGYKTFSTLFWDISHSKKKWSSYDQKHILIFLSDFNETWIFWTQFRKHSKFHENPSSGSGSDEADSRFTQFCEHA